MSASFVSRGQGVAPLDDGLRLIRFDIGRSSGEIDTGFDLNANDVVLDAWVDVITPESTAATKTIDVGLLSSESGGDADGFIDGISTATAGVKTAKVSVTTGANTKFFATTTRGVLLQDFQAGTDVDKDEGVACNKHHVCDGTAVSLTYTLGAAATELVAYGYLLILRVPSR